MISVRGLSRACSRLAPVTALAGLALVSLSLAANVRGGLFGIDFHGTIWQAGRDVLAGRNPYPAADAASLAAKGNPAVYPAPTLVATSPFGLLPVTAAAILWDLLGLAALVSALRLVGVRDWRVLAIVLLSFPVASTFMLAQLDPFLALGCALAWRWRDARGARLAVCVGATVAAKVFLWPLLLWLVAIGRRKQALGALAFGAGAAVAGWAIVGFSTLRGYPTLLSALTDAFGTDGYSLMALGTRLGASTSIARLLPLAALVVLCAVCVRLARRGRRTDALVAAVAAGILGSPILWMHYVVILLVVWAAKRPSLCAAWALPVAFWLSPTENPESGLDFALGLLTILAIVSLGVRRHPDVTVASPAARASAVAT